jgi:RND family efflux transporter MFP subunit
VAALSGSCGRGERTTAAPTAGVRIGAEDVVTVKEQRISAGPTFSGTLTAANEATVRAEIPGSVTAALVDSGERVTRGQVLARIDPGALGSEQRSAQSGVRAALTALTTAQRDLERQEELFREGIISRSDIEAARARASQARASVAAAQAQASSASEQLGRAVVRSPMTGVVSARSVSQGDVVQVGAALYTIVDPSTLQLAAAIPAEDLSQVRVGMPVSFTVTGFPGRWFGGRIARINPTADPATRQIQVFVEIPNPERTLVGGLYAEGRVATESRVGLVVPAAAVDRRTPQAHVVKLAGGRVSRVPVEVGVVDEKNDRVEVRGGGLAKGDQVLVGASRELTPGTIVQSAGP